MSVMIRRWSYCFAAALTALSACKQPANDGVAPSTSAVASSAPRVAIASASASGGVPVPSASATNAAAPPTPPKLKYAHARPTSGTPPRPALESVGGGGQLDTVHDVRGLLIDVGGGVWRFTESDKGKRGQRVGLVPKGVVAQMRAAAMDAQANPPVADGLGCKDCGSGRVLVYAGPHGDGAPLLVASVGEHPRRASTPACQAAVDWINAVEQRALRLPRYQPFGLQLPIITDLSDAVSSAPAPVAAVFTIEHRVTGLVTGLVIDANGDLFRFYERGNDARVFRSVGKVGPRSVAKLQSLAVRATKNKSWRDGAKGALCTSVLWSSGTGGAEPLVFSKECDGGGRLLGADASAVIAWVSAVDEQAVKILESSWPR